MASPPGPAKYADNSENPLSEEERKRIERMTSDPLSFSDQFTYWLNNKFIQNFEPLPHGAQLWMSADWTNPSAAANVVTWGTVEHDTNAYNVGNTLVVPVKLGGVYAISAVWEYDETDTGTDPAAGIFVNNVPVVVAPVPVTGTGYDKGTHMMLSRTIHLNGLDVVDVRSYKSAGTQKIKATGASTIVAAFNIARIYAIDDYSLCIAPANTVAPALDVAGFMFVGDIVSTTTGTWTGTAAISYTYQWQWQNEGAGGWVDIAGETGSSIDTGTFGFGAVFANGLDPNDGLRCVVTATNSCGAISANSNEEFFDAE